MLKWNINRKFLLFIGLFLVSGFTGLIYEVIWERILEVYFGVNTLSVALIVSAYMLGLGLGSLFGGRLSQIIKNPLLAYGILEGGIGLIGLLSPSYFVWLGTWTAGSPLSVVFILSFASLLLPTMLMGATLPILFPQAFIEKVSHSGTIISILYGINTLGAAFGAFISGFVLIGRFGLIGTVNIAVALNVVISLLSILAVLRLPQKKVVQESSQEGEIKVIQTESRWGYRHIIFSAFMIGFIDLAFQMIWFRILLITNSGSTYTFPTLLFVFLFGLGAGSYFIGRSVDRQKNPILFFVQLQMVIALVATFSFLVFYYLLGTQYLEIPLRYFANGRMKWPLSPYILTGLVYVFSNKAALNSILAFLVIPVLLVLPTSFFMGGGLPILNRIAINKVQLAGRKIGDLYLANILGSVFGTLAVPFILFDRIGSENTIKLLLTMSLIFPLLFILSRPLGQNKFLFQQKKLLGLGTLIILSLFLLPNGHWLYSRIIEKGMGVSAVINEDQDAVISLTSGKRSYLLLNGEAHSYFPSNMIYEGDAILCAGAAKPKHILIIGFGGGHTASVLAQTPEAETITVVELLNGLHTFLESQIDFIGDVIRNPKLDYVIDDGRRYLYANPTNRYDMIIIDPQWTSAAGSNNLYSTDALRLYQRHLNENGVLCAWTNEDSIMPTTFAAVFPYLDKLGQQMIVKNSPIRYDYQAMQNHQEQFLSSQAKNISKNGELLLDPASLLSTYKWDQEAIRDSQNKVPILNDLNPYLEYYFSFQANSLNLTLETESAMQNLLKRIDNCGEECQKKLKIAFNLKNLETASLENYMVPCQLADSQEKNKIKVLFYLSLNNGLWWVINPDWKLELWETDPQINCR